MIHIFFTAANAVLPIVLLIALGWYLRLVGFLSEDFVRVGNKLVFRVCLPCMLFVNVYDIHMLTEVRADVVAYGCAAVLVIFALGLLSAPLVTPFPERRGVFLQCTFRSNFAIIGMSLASALAGDSALAVTAVLSAFTIPLFNILAVVSLSLYIRGDGTDRRRLSSVVKAVVRNPLIIGVVLGLLCLALRALQVSLWGSAVLSLREDLPFLYTALRNLKSIASPLALLVMGGQFRFSSVRGLFREIAASTLFRLILAPLIGLGGAVLLSRLGILSFGASEYAALIALFASPVAVSSGVMAGEMGSDEQLGTQLVIWTSLLSVFSVFFLVCVMMYLGLF